jgi:hypothetical protein
MWWTRKIDIRMINPSSKISLKMSCLASCRGDIDRASKLYKFLSDGIENIPDYDVPRPTAVQQFSDAVNNIFGFIDQNEDKFMKAYNMVQMFRNGGGATQMQAVTDIPPLPAN